MSLWATVSAVKRLYAAAGVVLLVGVVLLGAGWLAPPACEDNYALETTELPGENATNETIVDVTELPPDLQNTTQKSVESNQTAFVDRDAYEEHLENRSVRYAGTVYETDMVLVQDCGGSLDDAILILGLTFATVGSVALSLLVVLDNREKLQ